MLRIPKQYLAFVDEQATIYVGKEQLLAKLYVIW